MISDWTGTSGIQTGVIANIKLIENEQMVALTFQQSQAMMAYVGLSWLIYPGHGGDHVG